MKNNKNYRFKLICYSLVIFIALQACGSSNAITVKAESNRSTIEDIRKLEMQAKGPNIVVLVEKNEKNKVKQLNRVRSDSVFFDLKNGKIAGYKIEEVKAYHIYKKRRIPIIGIGLFTASSLYGLDAFYGTDTNAQNNISFNVALASFYGKIIVTAVTGVVSLVVMASEFNSANRFSIFFTQSLDGVNISTSNSNR